MMVIFVSQCEKKALKRTRQVLDAFADRIGDNTWQTAITEEGLQAVKKLLRKTASKNTAVSCHWIRSRARSDLLWVVGNKRQFDYRGVVAVNRTKRNIVYSDEQNNWFYISSIQIMATLAALLHDIGKSTVGFQNKLSSGSLQADPYRHEWISLKLFELLIEGCQTDEEWLKRLTVLEQYLSCEALITAFVNSDKDKTIIGKMPPLAQWVAWLIVSHHRLPPYDAVFHTWREKARLQEETNTIKPPLSKYYQKYLRAFDYWVKNPTIISTNTPTHNKRFWQIQQLVLHSPAWQKVIKRWANKALADTTLMQISQQAFKGKQAISDTSLLYLSRLCLMVGDHNYSSLKNDDKRRLQGDANFHSLAANTNKLIKETEQALDEHLLGVAAFTARFAHHLPTIATALPSLKELQLSQENTSDTRFQWQNQAYKAMQTWQHESKEHGFFGINMASTGCGKTIGNARIMYALADPKAGARFTIALGLRVLTLQTGLSFRHDLHLNKTQLAVLVGGQAHKQLFELQQESSKPTGIVAEVEQNSSAVFGSESSEEWIDESIDVDIDYADYADLNINTLIDNPKARDLLFAPIVTCTIDHIIQASECKRGGKYIAPMLRLLSSDLILDEPDDFDKADLPALDRLVHLAGLLGSRVLLSSATLTPDLIEGLFTAYQAGRKLYHHSQNKNNPNIVCAWFDEQKKSTSAVQCQNVASFTIEHERFIRQREQFLAQQAVRRKADILPLPLSAYKHEQPEVFYRELVQTIVDGAIRLHNTHHQIAPDGQKQASIGLVRIANINNIIPTAMQMLQHINLPEDVHIHLSCYHARQVLVLRNALEKKLDKILRRKEYTLFQHTEIMQALNKSPAEKQIFIVLASPVAEVGRDHDYDWAIVEPSSMRSIIQLAGRVWRHRPEKVAEKDNILLLQYNLRHFTSAPNKPIFIRPGFESTRFKLPSHDINQLISQEQLAHIDARPRIIKPKDTSLSNLSALEHQVIHDLLNNSELNYVNAYWNEHASANRVHTHLQQISPFRAGKPQEDWILIPCADSEAGFDVYYAEDVDKNGIKNASKHNTLIRPLELTVECANISPWLDKTLVQALLDLQTQATDFSIESLAVRYASVSLEKINSTNSRSWYFNYFLGFIRK